jgi:hypothetical protein
MLSEDVENTEWTPPSYASPIETSESASEWKPPSYASAVEKETPKPSVFSKIKEFLTPPKRLHPSDITDVVKESIDTASKFLKEHPSIREAGRRFLSGPSKEELEGRELSGTELMKIPGMEKLGNKIKETGIKSGNWYAGALGSIVGDIVSGVSTGFDPRTAGIKGSELSIRPRGWIGKSTEAPAYETSRLYDEAIKEGYSDAAARKASGLKRPTPKAVAPNIAEETPSISAPEDLPIRQQVTPSPSVKEGKTFEQILADFGGSGHPESPEYVDKVLRKAGPGKSGLSVEPIESDKVADLNTQHVVYRDKKGSPVAVAKIVQDQNGNNLVQDLAADKSKGLLTGRAMKSIGDKLVELKATEPAGTISPDAQNFMSKMKESNARRAENINKFAESVGREVKTPEVVKPGESPFDFEEQLSQLEKGLPKIESYKAVDWTPPEYAKSVSEEAKTPEVVSEGAPPIREKTGNFFIDDKNRMEDEALSRRADPIRAAEDKAKIDEWNRTQENLRRSETPLRKEYTIENAPPNQRAKMMRGANEPVDILFKDPVDRQIFGAGSISNRFKGTDASRIAGERLGHESKYVSSKFNVSEQEARGAILDYNAEVRRLGSTVDKEGGNITAPSFEEFIKDKISPEEEVTMMHGGLGSIGGGKKQYPPSTGPAGAALDKLFNAMGGTLEKRLQQDVINKTERARRFAAFAGVKEEGVSGAAKSLGKLRGEFEKINPVEGLDISDREADTLFTAVKRAKITEGEKARGYTSLFAILNGDRLPQRNELKILDEVFGNGFADRVTMMHGGIGAVGIKLSKLANTMKSMMSSVDLSAPLRQGIGLIHRREFGPAFADMFKFFGKKEFFDSSMEKITSSPNYLLKREAGLFIAKPGSLQNSEEAFLNSYVGDIPRLTGVPQAVEASDRAYTGFLNKLRDDVSENMLKKAESLGYKKATIVGEGDKAQFIPTKETKAIMRFVNIFSGRGELPFGLEKMTNELNTVLWSPRMMASRIQMFTNPKIYTDLPKGMRLEGLKSLLAIASLGTVVDTALAFAGAKVSYNILSTDFGKSRFGTKLLDPWGGLQQYVVGAARFLAGKTDNSTPKSRIEIAGRFLAGKESPAASLAHTLLAAKKFTPEKGAGSFTTQYGQQTSIQSEIGKRFIPMFIQDLGDLATSEPDFSENIGLNTALGAAALLGMGVQNYPEKKTGKLGFKKMKLR